MATANVGKDVRIGNKTFASTTPSAAYGVTTNVAPITLNAAKTGSLTTRSSATAGTLTMDSGHGLSTGIIDIFWTESGVKGSRRNVSGTVTSNSIAITGGSGDNLPTNLNAITAVHPQTESVTLNADNLVLIGATINSDSHCQISVGTVSGSYTEGAAIELNDGTYGRCRVWSSNTDGTNPLDAANTFTTIKVSQGGTSTATLDIGFAGE